MMNNSMPNKDLMKTLPLIKSLSNYLLILVKDLDYFSQKQLGTSGKIELAETSLEEILIFLKQIGKGLIKKNGKDKYVKFRIKKQMNMPDKFITDETKLKQILINLLSNSIKFTNNGQIKVEVFMSESEEKGFKFVIFDTGVGMSDNTKINIFKPYNKGTANHNKTGAGLGLSIVNDLSMGLGGKIEFQSTIGSGSKFWFTIPIKEETKITANSFNLVVPATHQTISSYSEQEQNINLVHFKSNTKFTPKVPVRSKFQSNSEVFYRNQINKLTNSYCIRVYLF